MWACTHLCTISLPCLQLATSPWLLMLATRFVPVASTPQCKLPCSPLYQPHTSLLKSKLILLEMLQIWRSAGPPKASNRGVTCQSSALQNHLNCPKPSKMPADVKVPFKPDMIGDITVVPHLTKWASKGVLTVPVSPYPNMTSTCLSPSTPNPAAVILPFAQFLQRHISPLWVVW